MSIVKGKKLLGAFKMNKRLSWITSLVIVLMLMAVTQAGTYTSELNSYLEGQQLDDMIDVIISMEDKSVESQVGITDRLEELVNQGQIAEYRSMLMGRMITATATRTALDELVTRSDVKLISPRKKLDSNNDEFPIPNDTEDGLNVILLRVYAGTETALADYLVSSGLVASVTVYELMTGTPTLSELQTYDMIFFWGMGDVYDISTLDPILIECANLGMPIITFGYMHFFFGLWTEGSYMTTVCPVLPPAGMNVLTGVLGDYDETSPIMEGIGEISDSYGTIMEVPAVENAVVHASWDNGYPLVATRPDYPSVAAINTFPCDEMTSGGGLSGDIFRLVLNTAVYLVEGSGNDDYEYLPGDANMSAGSWPPTVIGSDVTYLVNYFRGISTPCMLSGFYASGDVNADCVVIGSDVTYLVRYFRGAATLSYCADYEPAWQAPEDFPSEAPDGWPNCEE